MRLDCSYANKLTLYIQKAATSKGRAKVIVGSDASCGASSGLCTEQPNLRGWRAGSAVMGVTETAVVATTTEVRAGVVREPPLLCRTERPKAANWY